MRDLASLQRAMAAAILAGDASSLAGELTAGGAHAGRRLGILRNNSFLSLTAHLKAVFPVTAHIADERFFAYAAHSFIRVHPPREPRLSAYGGDFARFLAVFPASRRSPLLAEMARLEWAVHSALISAEKPSCDRAALASVTPEMTDIGLDLQPSLHFVLTRWPLLELWSGEKQDGAPFQRRLSRLAVYRRDDRIRFLELGSARLVFWKAIAKGLPLHRAAERALARESRLHLAAEILLLFDCGLVTALKNPATG